MAILRSSCLSLFCFLLTFDLMNCLKRPNVVIIVADDMGFDDVSFRGSNEYLTPNIDALAYSGVILKNFYTPAMCTPSRAALLTGKYPIHTGMQHYVIPNYQPWGLPTNETTLANIFQDNGYFTSLIGKWHLGMSRMNYTPTFRGFDHHYGYLGSYIDYYKHSLYTKGKKYAPGHDFRLNLNVTRQRIGIYATDVLTESAVELIEAHNFEEQPLFMFLSHLAPHTGNENAPLQAPEEEIEKFNYIRNKNRRIYAAMVSLLDDGVAKVIDSLARKQVLDDTILLFFSDNGGPTAGQHANKASNFPLRGQKNSPWEGGLRSSCAVWTSKLNSPGTVWTQHVSIVDLLPTLAKAANIRLEGNDLDGLDMWSELLAADNAANKEREIMHNIDDIFDYVSYGRGSYKFVNGTTLNGKYDGWLSRRPPTDSDEEDPRASNYEQAIKATSVWQHLQSINKPSPNAKPNITRIRQATAVECKYENDVRALPCMPLLAPCLFNIEDDPCEQRNLFTEPAYANISLDMLERIAWFRQSAVPPRNKPEDPRSDPRFYNYEWTWWEDLHFKNFAKTHSSIPNIFYLLVSCSILNYYVINHVAI